MSLNRSISLQATPNVDRQWRPSWGKMTILRRPAADAPLRQGDVLFDVVTATSTDSGPKVHPSGVVMVVSRNCVAIRSKEIVVAKVFRRPLQGLMEEASGIEEMVDYFVSVRDGDGSPGSFYLGELEEGTSDRYVAKLDQLFTIEIPEAAEERRGYAEAHRRYTLTEDFAADLHQRLFRAYASMGFDDDRWWSDEDLRLIISRGRALLDGATSQVTLKQSELEIATATGAGDSKKAKAPKQECDDLDARAKKIRKQLAPLEAEQHRREREAHGDTPNLLFQQA